jgi:hypothetical protein
MRTEDRNYLTIIVSFYDFRPLISDGAGHSNGQVGTRKNIYFSPASRRLPLPSIHRCRLAKYSTVDVAYDYHCHRKSDVALPRQQQSRLSLSTGRHAAGVPSAAQIRRAHAHHAVSDTLAATLPLYCDIQKAAAK